MKWRYFLLALLNGLLLTSAQASDDPFSMHSPWMTGDWNGLRSQWRDAGIDLKLNYTANLASNLAGGYDHDRTLRYSDQYAIGSLLDLDKLADLHHAEFSLLLTERNGRDLTSDRLQDPRTPTLGSTTQGIYGRGQTWHITQLWYRQRFFNDLLDLKLGRIAIGDEFDNMGCLFQNISLCGALGAHGATVWYNAPISQWGARLKIVLSGEQYLQVGLFQHNPSYLGSSGSFKLEPSGGEGMMSLMEYGWTPHLNGLPGNYKIGAWYNSVDAADVRNDDAGRAKSLSHQPARQHNGRYGGWLYGQQQVTAEQADKQRGLRLFGHISLNDRASATVDYQLQAGAFYIGTLAGRPRDDLGIGLSMLHVNNRLADNDRLSNEARGLDDVNAAAYKPVRDAEYVMELHYGVVVAPWLTVRPNIQLLSHLGGNGNVQDAWVVGTQVLATF